MAELIAVSAPAATGVSTRWPSRRPSGGTGASLRAGPDAGDAGASVPPRDRSGADGGCSHPRAPCWGEPAGSRGRRQRRDRDVQHAGWAGRSKCAAQPCVTRRRSTWSRSAADIGLAEGILIEARSGVAGSTCGGRGGDRGGGRHDRHPGCRHPGPGNRSLSCHARCCRSVRCAEDAARVDPGRRLRHRSIDKNVPRTRSAALCPATP